VSYPKVRVVDISPVSDFSSNAFGAVRPSMPSVLQIEQEKVLRMAPDLVFVHQTAGANKTLIGDNR
jgi:hypothetical protein